MKHEPLRLRDIIAVDPTRGWLPDDEVGLIPYQYHKRHRSYVEDEDMDIDEHLMKKANDMPKFVPWVEK